MSLDLLVAILTGLLGFASGVLGSYFGFDIWPRWRRKRIYKSLTVRRDESIPSERLPCRVENASPYTITQAVAYVTIQHDKRDVIAPVFEHEAHNTPEKYADISDAQLCWGVREGGKNPMRIDIYAGERQPLFLGKVWAEHIGIVSEEGTKPWRAFLRRAKYEGILTIVCQDCPAKMFRFTINPDDNPVLQFHDE